MITFEKATCPDCLVPIHPGPYPEYSNIPLEYTFLQPSETISEQ